MSLLITRGLGLSGGGGEDLIVYGESFEQVVLEPKRIKVKEPTSTKVTLQDDSIKVKIIKRVTKIK